MGAKASAVIATILLCSTSLFAQSVFTIAGGGPLGDGLAATKAVLNSPSDVAFDSQGNMFLADTANNRVRKVEAATGIISTIAGGGTSGRGDGGSSTGRARSAAKAGST